MDGHYAAAHAGGVICIWVVMNRIEEKLYVEIWLCCEKDNCLNDFEPSSDAQDPMDEWAKENCKLAITQGWTISKIDKIYCPSCSKVTR